MNRIGYSLLLIFSFTLFGLSPTQAVSQYLKDRWNSGNGLPQNSVKTILQTDDGYLWFGTQEGLVKYNGQRMVVYDQLYFKGAISSEIYVLEHGDQPGTIWIGTMGSGLIYFNYLKGQYHIITKKDGLPSNNIFNLKQDQRGNLWMDVDHKHLVQYRDGTVYQYLLPESDSPTPLLSIILDKGRLLLSGKYPYILIFKDGYFTKSSQLKYKITRLYRSDDGTIFVLGYGGISRYDPKEDQFFHLFREQMEKWRLTRMIRDRDHNLWITTGRKGVFRLRPGAKTIDVKRDWLKTSMAITLIEDREGSIWIGDNLQGILRLKEGKVSSYGQYEGLRSNEAYVLLPTKEGQFYTGTLDGGISEFKDGAFIDRFPELKGEMILSMDQDHQGNIWALLYKKRIIKISPEGEITTISDNRLGVAVVFADSRGDIWIGTGKQGVYRYRDGKEIEHYAINGFVCSIVEVTPGEIWVGTFGKGLQIIKEGKMRSLSKKDGLCDDEIFSIRPQKDGTIWFGTNRGICYYDGKKYHDIKREEGLPVFAIGDLIIDHRDNLWGCSNKGIVFATKKEISDFLVGKTAKIPFKLWGKSEGMRNPECNGGAQNNMVLYQNKVYFSTMGGMVVVDPDNIPNNNHKPPVFIEQIIVDGKKYPIYKNKIMLPAGSQKLEFHYSGLSFYSLNGVTFKYQLKGYDATWVNAQKRDVAYYTNLFPGTYQFRVIAANNDGIWSELPSEVTLILPPLFKQTVWYRVIQVAGIIAIVILLFFYRIRRMRRQRIHLQYLVDQKTKELKEAALIDPLTGLKNRRFVSDVILPELGRFMELKKYISRGANQRKSFSSLGVYGIYLYDIDHFKKVNDLYGHDAGDRVLKQFSDLLKSCIRDNDFLIRWGGEEFLVLLKETDPEYMDQFVCRFRNKLNNYQFIINDQGEWIQKRCSVGYLQYPPVLNDPELFTFDQCVMFSDQGLYYAKRNGRDMAVKINFNEKVSDLSINHKLFEDLEFGIDEGSLSISVIKEGDCYTPNEDHQLVLRCNKSR